MAIEVVDAFLQRREAERAFRDHRYAHDLRAMGPRSISFMRATNHGTARLTIRFASTSSDDFSRRRRWASIAAGNFFAASCGK